MDMDTFWHEWPLLKSRLDHILSDFTKKLETCFTEVTVGPFAEMTENNTLYMTFCLYGSYNEGGSPVFCPVRSADQIVEEFQKNLPKLLSHLIDISGDKERLVWRLRPTINIAGPPTEEEMVKLNVSPRPHPMVWMKMRLAFEYINAQVA